MRARSGLGQIFWRFGGRQQVPERKRCANCGITLDADEGRDAPGRSSSSTPDAAAVYCCDGCADGGPCIC